MKARVSSFDVVRGVAILMVFVAHAIHYAPTGVRIVDAGLGLGRFGVQLFFILSAASVCLMWEQRSDEHRRTFKFYIRRLLRIAPLYWIFIPISLMYPSEMLATWRSNGIHALDIALNFVFLHALWPPSINSIVPGGWSISVEVLFYITFPVFVALFRDRPIRYVAFGISTWLASAYFLTPLTSDVFMHLCSDCRPSLLRDFSFLTFHGQVAVFMMGCAIYFYFHQGRIREGYISLSIWGLIGSMVAADAHMDRSAFGLVFITLGIFAFLCFHKAVTCHPIEFIGRNSYALYLCHFLVLETFSNFWPGGPSPTRFVVLTAISFAVSLFAAATIHRLIDPWTALVTSKLVRRLH